VANKTAVLAVKIISDAKGAVNGLEHTDSLLSRVGATAGRIAKAGLAAAGTAAVGLGVAGVKAAADLEQSIGAVDAVFGPSAKQIHGWADSAAVDVGLTKNEFNELATVIGTQLKNGGTSMDELAPKTRQLITLGADLSSMFGGTTAEAVGALSSALKGERDPIERYGVSLTQAAIDAKAAELGFQKVGGSLSTEANQAATLALIMEQTADAHGNFAKESDTVTHKVEVLKATWGNVVATIGNALLPVVSTLLTVFASSLMPVIVDAAGRVKDFAGAVNFTGIIQAAIDILTPFANSFLNLGGSAQPLLPLLGQLLTGGVMPLVKGFAEGLAPIIKAVADTVLPPLIAAFGKIIPAITPVLASLGDLARAIGEKLAPIITRFKPLVEAVFNAVANIIRNAMQIVKGVLDVIVGVLTGDWRRAWEGVKSIVSGAVKTVGSVIKGLASTIKNAFGAAGHILWDVGKQIIQGLINGIKSAGSGVAGAIRNLVSSAVSKAKSLLGIHSPSRVFADIGVQTGAGLANGMRSMTRTVASASAAMIDAAVPDNAPVIDYTVRRHTTSGAGGGTTINITINGAIDPVSTAQQIRRILEDYDRLGGRIEIGAGA